MRSCLGLALALACVVLRTSAGDIQLPPTLEEVSVQTTLLSFASKTFSSSSQLSNWRFSPASVCRGSLSSWQGITCRDGSIRQLLLGSLELQGSGQGLQFEGIASLETIDLSHNPQIGGELPASWAGEAFSNLEFLDLTDCNLSGGIPDEWSNFSRSALQELNLAQNNLSGPLPSTWTIRPRVSAENTGLCREAGSSAGASDEVPPCTGGAAPLPAPLRAPGPAAPAPPSLRPPPRMSPPLALLPQPPPSPASVQPPPMSAQPPSSALALALAPSLTNMSAADTGAEAVAPSAWYLSPPPPPRPAPPALAPPTGTAAAPTSDLAALPLPRAPAALPAAAPDVFPFSLLPPAPLVLAPAHAPAPVLTVPIGRRPPVPAGRVPPPPPPFLLPAPSSPAPAALGSSATPAGPGQGEGDGDGDGDGAGAGLVAGVAVAAAVGGVLLTLVGLFSYRHLHRKRPEKLLDVGSSSSEEKGTKPLTRRLSRAPTPPASPQSSSGFWIEDPDAVEIHPDDLLGAGAFGEVFRGYVAGLGTVAVKTLKHGSKASSREFKKEVAILRDCVHPNVVRALGACCHPNNWLLIMEYAEGGDLGSALKDYRDDCDDSSEVLDGDDDSYTNGPYSWYQRGGAVALDVARALAYLHEERKLAHFDLKSRNVLLTADGVAKVADYGLAQPLLTVSHIPGDFRGTWAYAALEMLEGTRCTTKADIFSYAVLLWEISTGQEPQRGRCRPIRCPTEAPAAVGELIKQCMQPNPDVRPTAKEIVQILEQSMAC